MKFTIIFLIGITVFPLIANAYHPNESYDFTHLINQDEIQDIEKEYSGFLSMNNVISSVQASQRKSNLEYWKTVHSVESSQGANLYRPRNKSKSCRSTKGPCGHHQLTVQALKDIGCTKSQCKKDRENYTKSLQMSKKLLKLNEKRLSLGGLKDLPDYQKYLIHQQGASGLKTILKASKGKKVLSRKIRRNMANNSPYSYRALTNMGSKKAAKSFFTFWKKKWEREKLLVSLDKIPSAKKPVSLSKPSLLAIAQLSRSLKIN